MPRNNELKIIDVSDDENNSNENSSREERIIDISNDAPSLEYIPKPTMPINVEETLNYIRNRNFNNLEISNNNNRSPFRLFSNHSNANFSIKNYPSNMELNPSYRGEELRREREEERRRERKEEKRKEKKEHKRLIKAATNLNIFDGSKTINRDKKYNISTREAKYDGETLILLQGDINMVEVVRSKAKSVYLSAAGEATIIDPNNHYLKKHYRKFISKNEKHFDNLSDDRLAPMLNKVFLHVAEACGNDEIDHEDKETRQQEMIKEKEYKNYVKIGDSNKKVKALMLEDVMINNAANCRYNAMYLSLVLAKLVSDGKLPDGEVYIVRNTLKSGNGHAWVCYKTYENDQLFFVDPYYDSVPLIYDLNIDEQRHKAKKEYGSTIINQMIERYRDAKVLSSPQLR